MKVLASALAAALTFASAPAFAAPDFAQIDEAARVSFILPAYEKLEAATKTLAEALAEDCAVGKSDARQKAFHDAMDAWQRVQLVRHGPIADEDRHARMQFWPDKRSIVGRHVSQWLATAKVEGLEAEKFAGASVAIQGFPALERLLFEPPGISTAVEKGNAIHRCAAARTVARNVHLIAVAAVNGWQNPSNDNEKEHVGQYFQDLATELQLIAENKLSHPAGKDGAPVRATLAESWRSERSLTNIKQNLMAVKALYEILAAGITSDAQHKLIEHQFGEAFDMLAGWGPSLKKMLEDKEGPVKARALSYVMASLRELIIIKLMRDLDLKLGFNSLDGD